MPAMSFTAASGWSEFIVRSDISDITKMMKGSSCASLETILNEAAIYAGYARKDRIETEHIVKAILKIQYNMLSNAVNDAELERIAYDEAGHCLVMELLAPDSIGLMSVNYSADKECGEFMRRYRLAREKETDVMVSLAGRAEEILFKSCSNGAFYDLCNATKYINHQMIMDAKYGMGLLLLNNGGQSMSKSLFAAQEAVSHAELEVYYNKTKRLLLDNREILDALEKALIEKGFLLNSEIRTFIR